ncbi:MAG: ATP-binding protein [Pseudomonadota bacterium]
MTSCINEKDFALALLETMQAIVLVLDPEGKIVQYNTYMEKLSGYKLEEVKGKNWFETFLPKCDQPRIFKLFQKAIDNCQTSGNQNSIITKDGEKRIIEWHDKTLTDEHGKGLYLICVGQDVTDREKIEQEIYKADRLQSIGILANGVAHDFNNMLTSIMTNISLAAIIGSSDPGYVETLAEAEHACLLAKNLIEQLVTFAKDGEPNIKSTSITELLMESTRFALRGSNVGVDFYLPSDLWPATADLEQIARVIHNIALNAREAMPNGGKIVVRAENVYLNVPNTFALPEGDYVKIEIHDRGRGMSSEAIKMAFDPYFSTKTRGTQKGMGLGLSICHSIVKQHHGHIEVSSQPCEGTTLSIYLPATSSLSKDDNRGIIKGKVLVMDDEPQIRKSLYRALTYLGYETKTTENGLQAIQLYKEALATDSPFNAVVLDLTVQNGMGAIEAIKILSEHDPKVCGILTTGHSQEPILSEYRAHRFRAILKKPYSLNGLRQALLSALGDQPCQLPNES